MTASRPPMSAQVGFGLDEVSRGNPGEKRQPTSYITSCVAAIGLAFVAVSVALPWLRVGTAGTVELYTGIELPVLAVVLLALALSSLACVAFAIARQSHDARDLAMLGAGATACVSGVLLILVECASAVIPNGLLPATIRRYTLDLRAGPGLWLAFAASAIALAALSGRLRAEGGNPLAGHGLRIPVRPAAALAALSALAITFGVLRYAPWVDATAAGQHYGIGGWGLPWVGPLSLIALLGLIAAAATALARRDQAAALLAGASSWLITLAAALTIIASDTLANVRFADFAPAKLRGYVPHLGPGSAAAVSFAIGLAGVGVAAGLLATIRPDEEQM